MQPLRKLRWLLVSVAVAALIVLLQPWTIRPIGETASRASSAAFDPAAYVETIWQDRVAHAEVQPLAPGANVTAPTMIAGEGRVTAVDVSSRVGLMRIDLAPGDGVADVALQIGPVLRGGALRDAVGLGFADFASQMDYANVAEAMNTRALAGIPALQAPADFEGGRVRFIGAAAPAPDGAVIVTPITLERQP